MLRARGSIPSAHLGSHPPKESPDSVEADLGMGSRNEANPLLWGLGSVQLGGDAARQQLLDILSPHGGTKLHVAVLSQQLHQLFLLCSPKHIEGEGGQVTACPPP